MRRFIAIPAIFFIALCSTANAQSSDLKEYLNSMNLTEITFSGRIKYNDNSLNDIPFTFYDAEGSPFPVTIDAGRKTRERIETECENSSFMVSLKDLCEVQGAGTVEIRGSRIHLSIDEVTELKKP